MPASANSRAADVLFVRAADGHVAHVREAQRGRALAEPAPSQPHILKSEPDWRFIRRDLLHRS